MKEMVVENPRSDREHGEGRVKSTRQTDLMGKGNWVRLSGTSRFLVLCGRGASSGEQTTINNKATEILPRLRHYRLAC